MKADRSSVRLAAPVSAIVVLLLLWELTTRAFDIRAIALPRPTDVFAAIADNPSFFLSNTWVTLAEAGLGLVIGFLAAGAAASLMAHSRVVERLSWPAIIVLQSTPIVVLAPLLLIWFGFGLIPKALIVALFVFVPFTTNMLTGLRSVTQDLLNVASSVDASRLQVYRSLRIPHALADTFAAARICVSLALVGAVISEFYGGSTSGLGYQFRRALSRIDPEVAWGCIVILASIGIVGTFAVLALESRVLHWHPAYRRDNQ
jgi:NitT/TauT family transport system permease protein